MNYDDAFTPETIEEQIDQHTFSPSSLPLSPNARVIQELQAYYEEDRRSAANMWERLASRVSELDSAAKPSEPLQRSQGKGTRHMQQLLNSPAPEHTRERNAFQRRLGLLVAVILMVLLVGSLATVLELSHQKPSTRTTSSRPGQVVYSGPQENGSLTTPVWSADSQELAASDGIQTKIWEATTGQHSITIPLAGTLAWSPTSDLLAIASSYTITIVNGKTGQTIRAYSYPVPPAPSAAAVAPSTGITPLVSRFPLGAPSGIGGFAWSPDGKWIVSTYSYATSDGMAVADGVVQVWNAQTGQLGYTLATEPGYKMHAAGVSWSADGQYIAANMGKWNGEYSQMSVWSVQTRQVVFQQSVNSNQGFVSSSWQPGTDNLASALIIPGSNSSTPGPGTPSSLVLKIWNVKTGQLLKSYPGTFPGIDELSWSPDGQQVVYSFYDFTATAAVIILDVNSGQKVYTYQVSDPVAQSIRLSGTWSPDGKYIASVENIDLGNGRNAYVVKVWTA